MLDVTEPGQVSCGIFDGDLRTDLPSYRVYEDGEPVAEMADVRGAWRDDLVAFLIGWSFTFEAALLEAGAPVRHIEAGTNVPMYRTDRECTSAGSLHGPLVVSMRPVPALGIADLATPDFGDPVEVRDGEVPVFWACGVTPQAAVMASRPPFAIGHAPGMMAITDARDSAYVVP